MRDMLVTAALAALIATGAKAQDMKTFASSAEVQALIANAKATIKPGQPTLSQHILTLAPYNVNLEYRVSGAPAAVHEKEAEVFYVVEGAATMVTGGKLTGEKRTNPANLSGDGITGGLTRRIAKGDFVIVPEGSPHQITAVEGGALSVMTFHVPRG